MPISRIKLGLLRLDFQSPDHIIDDVLREKMARLASGEEFEPIIVRTDGQSYFLQDGFHRVEAARQSGILELEAEIYPGTLEDMEQEFVEQLAKIREDLRSSG